MGELQLLVGCHVLGVRQLSIEGHDGSKCLAFGDQTELARSEIMVLAVTVHFRFFDRFQGLFEEVFDTQLHHHAPDVLAIVEDPGVFLLLLCTVEKASHQTDHDVLEDPL